MTPQETPQPTRPPRKWAITCDHCREPVFPDVNGYWVGPDDTSQCPVNDSGHEVDGRVR